MKLNLRTDLSINPPLTTGGAAIYALVLKDNPNLYLRLDWSGGPEPMESFVIESQFATIFDQDVVSILLAHEFYNMLKAVQLRSIASLAA